MNSEEKILEILTKMQTQQEQMQTQMGQMLTRQDRLEARQDRTEERLRHAQEDIQRVRLYLELDVETRFKGINEGIDMILERLVPEERIVKAEDDIVVLKTAVRALARDVAELKKAE